MSSGPSKWSLLADLVCAKRRQMRIVIMLFIMMGLLLLFSLTVVRPGDQVYPMIIIDGVLLTVSLAAFLGAYWYCIKREMDDEGFPTSNDEA